MADATTGGLPDGQDESPDCAPDGPEGDATAGDGGATLEALRDAVSRPPVPVGDTDVPPKTRPAAGPDTLTGPGSAISRMFAAQGVLSGKDSPISRMLAAQGVLSGKDSPISRMLAAQGVLSGKDSPISRMLAAQGVLSGKDSPISRMLAAQGVLSGKDSPISRMLAAQGVLSGKDSPISRMLATQSVLSGKDSPISRMLATQSVLSVKDSPISRMLATDGAVARFASVGSALDVAVGRGSVARAFADGLVTSNLRLFDAVVPPSWLGAELAATARLARLAVPSSAFAGWRGSLLAEHAAAALASSAGASVREALAGLDRSASVAAMLSSLAVGDRRRGAWPSAIPAGLFGEHVHGLGPGLSARDAVAGAAAGRGVAGLLAVDVLSLADRPRPEAEEAFERGVAEPWVDGPARARAEMMDALAGVDAKLPELLDGAWEDVERQGPGAVVKIAACTVEALERTLRVLAPDPDVLAWHGAGGRPATEVHNGRPTHGLRVRFVLREGKLGRLAAAQADAIAVQVSDLRSALQAGKHASEGQVSALRAHLLSVEAVLHQLVLQQRLP